MSWITGPHIHGCEEHRKAHDALCEKHGGTGIDPRGKRARLIARYVEKCLACGETETLTIAITSRRNTASGSHGILNTQWAVWPNWLAAKGVR